MAVSYLKCTMHKNMTLDSSLRCMRRITDVDIYNTLMRSLAKKVSVCVMFSTIQFLVLFILFQNSFFFRMILCT